MPQGQRINPETGELWELKGNKWVSLGIQTSPPNGKGIELFRSMDQPFATTEATGGQSAQSGQSAPMSFIRAAASKIAENAGNFPAAMAGGYVDAAMNPNPFAERRGPAPSVSYGDVVSQMAPDSDQILANVQRGGEMASNIASFSRAPISTREEALANQQRITQQNQANNPFAAGAGDVAGDVASLLFFRAPMAKNRAALDSAQAYGIRALEKVRKATEGDLTPAAKTFSELFGRGFANSPMAATLTRGTTKAAEAGIDGLMLGVMNRQDPIETASIGIGSQIGASLMLSTLTGFKGTGSPATRLAIAAAGTMGIIQALRVMTPIDEASPVTDLQAAYPKLIAGTFLGLAVGIIGGGRLSGTKVFEGSRELLPVLADNIQTAVRGLSLDTINKWMADPRIETTLTALSRDPDTFGAAAGRRIERAITNGNIDLSNTLDELSRNTRFRQTLESLNP